MKTTKEQITHYTTEDEQVEAMVNGQSDAIFETRRRKAIRHITHPMLIMLALTFVAWLITLLGLLGLVSGYLIPGWTDNGLLRHRRRVLIGLGLALAWMLLGSFSGAKDMGTMMALGLLAAGVLYGWSGRRTALGRATASQLLGLRRYLRGRDKQQLNRAKNLDPDYYFRMAPYAIALGVGKNFASAMGRHAAEGGCPYLIRNKEQVMDTRRWNALLEHTADLMDQRKQTRPLEKTLELLRRFTKP